MTSVEHSLQQQLLKARNTDGSWGYGPGRRSRLEPTCWALLATRRAVTDPDGVLADWPSSEGALLEHRDGLTTWPFHALALCTRSALGRASAEELQPLAQALMEARGVPPSHGQHTTVRGWSWTDGTFSWVEPTAWALVALKTCRSRNMTLRGCDDRIADGESILHARMCAAGGWSYGSSNVVGQKLPGYVPTTAVALLALQDRGGEEFVRRSVDYLEKHATSHASPRALALSVLALRQHGRSTMFVEEKLHAWFATHALPDVVSLAMAVCALAKSPASAEFAY